MEVKDKHHVSQREYLCWSENGRETGCYSIHDNMRHKTGTQNVNYNAAAETRRRRDGDKLQQSSYESADVPEFHYLTKESNCNEKALDAYTRSSQNGNWCIGCKHIKMLRHSVKEVFNIYGDDDDDEEDDADKDDEDEEEEEDEMHDENDEEEL